MTSQALPFPLRDAMTDSLSGQIMIVAEDRFISDLRAGPLPRGLDGALLHPLAATAPIPEALIRHARVIVLEVDAAAEESLARLASIRASHPNLAIVAALRQTDLALVRALIRQGVVDVTELPFVLTQLEEQVLDAYSRQAERQSTAQLGHAISVVGASGGAGATSLLTSLAAAIAQVNGGARGVCVVDLDLQRGSIASHLKVQPQVTIQALLDAGSRLDRELMLSAVTETDAGFSVIAAPDAIAPADRLDVDHLISTVKLIQSSFDYVLFDLPAMWTDWSLSVAGWSNQILLTTDRSISSLHQAKRTLALLHGLEIPSSRIGVVVNRIERSVFRTFRTTDIERVLGAQVAGTIVDAGPALREAQDQGLLLSAIHGKTKYSTDVAAIAEVVMAGGLT